MLESTNIVGTENEFLMDSPGPASLYPKLTSVRKELGVNVFETVLVDETLGAFLSIKNHSENTRKRDAGLSLTDLNPRYMTRIS